MKPLIFVVLALLTAPPAFSADCFTFFDQTCLVRDYKPQEIEAEQAQRQQELKDFEGAAREQERVEAAEDAREQARALEEARHSPPPLTERQKNNEILFHRNMEPDEWGFLWNLPYPEPVTNVRIVP